MITPYLIRISGFRFFGRGLYEISGEEVAVIAFSCCFCLSHVCGLSGI